MKAQITSDNTEIINGTSYRSIEAEVGKKSAHILITPEYLSVVVNNASHRAWRGLGKQFSTWDLAIDHYKSAAMKGLIEDVLVHCLTSKIGEVK